jgi:signal transduction histidine kinase/CheY-like chemotaxis protein
MALGNRKKEITELKQKLEACEAEIRMLKKQTMHESRDDSRYYTLPVLSRVMELNCIGFWIRSADNSVFWLSSTAKEILGISGEKITWDSFKNIILPEDRSLFEKTVSDISLAGKSTGLELKIARTDGDTREFRLIDMQLTGFSETAGAAAADMVIGSVTDISRQDKLKRDLIRARDKAEDAEKLKNMLLANISHEIRTPMNSIIGFSELMSIGNLPYDKRHEYVKTIKNQGIHILRMIDDLIELTRIETGKITIRKSPCNIDLLLHELLVIFNRYKKSRNKDLDIRINYPPKRGLVFFTDAGRLQQLMTNLIHNAIKFTEKGWIEIGYKPVNEEKIEFYVKDTGIGLSKEFQKNIFSPFAEDESQGLKPERSGLGLTISKNLIRLLGGKIWVESEPGQGSTFYFTIPHEEVPESYHILAPEEESEIPSYTWKDKVILIVEDDEVNFRFLEAVLQDTGVQILHASNGTQAVELCRSISKIDLVLMDLKMPEMDGFDATREIRTFNRKIPIIAQTAFVQENELQKCREAGCDDHITKPFEIKEFFEKIDKYLRER